MLRNILIIATVAIVSLAVIGVATDIAFAQQGRGNVVTVRGPDLGPGEYWYALLLKLVALVPLGVLIWSMFKFKFDDLHAITWFVLAWAALLFAIR
jgi:hypothetical protein